MKVVINSSYGAFALSAEAHTLYAKLKGYNLIKDGNDDFWTFYKNEESEENIIDENDITLNSISENPLFKPL